MSRPMLFVVAASAAILSCSRASAPEKPESLPSAGASATEDASLQLRMREHLQRVGPRLIALRRDIHRHPEVAGEERRTAELIAEHLRALDITVVEGVGGHGVVGLIEGGLPGAVVAYRADMDAVAHPAPDPVEFRSTTPGVRHICGHDIHVAVGLGVAEALVEIREQLPGSVKLIFQPAEETAEGAKAMIRDGALRAPRPDAIFAVHSAPLPVGRVGSVEGKLLPGLSLLTVELTGTGDLPAAAQAYRSAIAQAQRMPPPPQSSSASASASALLGVDTSGQQPPAERKPPSTPEPGVFMLMPLSSQRVAADGPWRLQVVIRASSQADYLRGKEDIAQRLGAIAVPGVSHIVAYRDWVVPDTVNHVGLTRASLPALRTALGADRVLELNQMVPFFSEDFSFFQKEIPGVMYWLGVANAERGISGMPHSPDFVADEGAIAVGARAMSALLLAYLQSNRDG